MLPCPPHCLTSLLDFHPPHPVYLSCRFFQETSRTPKPEAISFHLKRRKPLPGLLWGPDICCPALELVVTLSLLTRMADALGPGNTCWKSVPLSFQEWLISLSESDALTGAQKSINKEQLLPTLNPSIWLKIKSGMPSLSLLANRASCSLYN